VKVIIFLLFTVISAGILLTNNLSESDFTTINKKNNASNITNTTINSVKTENSNSQLDLVTTVLSAVETNVNLRRYQSDDSIYSNYLTKLMDRKSEDRKVIIEKKKEDIKDKNQVLIDPLGAYLLTSPPPNQPLCDPLIALEDESNKNEEKEKLVKLFEYQPFSSKQEEQDEQEENDQKCFCENDSFNDYNFDDENYSDEDDDEEDDDDDELDPFMVANDDDDDINEDEEEEEEEEERVEITKPTKSIDNENAILKDTNTLFSSFVKQVKQVTNLEKLKNVTMDKLENIKSTIQTNMPYSISQQEITTKIKSSFSNYKLNKNLISNFNGNSSNNSLNLSHLSHSYSFQNKPQNSKDTRSQG
jgi:hypothetical protein